MDIIKRKELFFKSAWILYSIYIVFTLAIFLSFGVIQNDYRFIEYTSIINEILGIVFLTTTLILIILFIVDIIVLRLLQYKVVNRKKYKEFNSNKSE